MSDSSIVIIQGTVGLYTVATRCHTCFAVTLKYTEDSSLTILRHSLVQAWLLPCISCEFLPCSIPTQPCFTCPHYPQYTVINLGLVGGRLSKSVILGYRLHRLIWRKTSHTEKRPTVVKKQNKNKMEKTQRN